MIREKSAGVICFRIDPRDGLQYLVLYHQGAYWNFPKGRMDPGENEKDTAIRELKEETGVTGVSLIDGWRQETSFFFKEGRNNKKELIKKDFVIFLAKVSPNTKINISHEHNGYAWLDYKTADKYLKFKNIRGILAEANSFILDKIKNYQRSKDNK